MNDKLNKLVVYQQKLKERLANPVAKRPGQEASLRAFLEKDLKITTGKIESLRMTGK